MQNKPLVCFGCRLEVTQLQSLRAAVREELQELEQQLDDKLLELTHQTKYRVQIYYTHTLITGCKVINMLHTIYQGSPTQMSWGPLLALSSHWRGHFGFQVGQKSTNIPEDVFFLFQIFQNAKQA